MSLFVTITLITMMLFLFSKETKTCLTKTLFNDDAADNETTRLWKNVRQILEKSQHYYYILAPKHCLENSLKTLILTIWIFFQHYFRHLGSIYKILKVALGFSLFSRPTLLHEYCTPTGIGGLKCAQVFLVRNGAKIVFLSFTVFDSFKKRWFTRLFLYFFQGGIISRNWAMAKKVGFQCQLLARSNPTTFGREISNKDMLFWNY